MNCCCRLCSHFLGSCNFLKIGELFHTVYFSDIITWLQILIMVIQVPWNLFFKSLHCMWPMYPLLLNTKRAGLGKWVGQWVKCFPEFRLPAPTHLQVQSLALVTPALRWEGAERSQWSSLASRGGWIRALLAFLRELLSETKVKSSWGTPDTYQWLARVCEACARPPTWTCAQHTSYIHNLRNTWKSKIIKHIN